MSGRFVLVVAVVAAGACHAARPVPTPTAPRPSSSASSSASATVAANAVDVRLALGATHSCASLPERGLYCWGNNERGQLGDGTKTQRSTPTRVRDAVHALAAGAEHTCADDVCFGRNAEEQLGDGTKIDRAAPAPATALFAGLTHDFTRARWLATARASCLVSPEDGGTSAYCTGNTSFPYPKCGGGPCGFWSVAESAYDDVICVLATAYSGIPTVRCNTPKLALESHGDDERTLGIPSLADHVGLAVGRDFVCAVRVDGRIECAGDLSRLRGTKATSFTTEPLDAERIVAGDSFVCYVRRDTRVLCFGEEPAMALKGPAPQIARRGVDGVSLSASQLAAGPHHVCVYERMFGSVACFGRNDHGQLGDGTTIDRRVVEAVRLLE